MAGKGIAINRNHALKYFHGDIAIFADDDVRYTDEYINNIFSVFKHSDVDIACFRAKTTENTMLHPYADFSFSISYTTGLCSFDIRWEDISFYDYGRIVKIGDSISVLTNDPDFHPMVAELSEVFIDEKTGKKSIGIAINSTGDDDWVYYTFGMDMMDGLNITISYMGYQQIN